MKFFNSLVALLFLSVSLFAQEVAVPPEGKYGEPEVKKAAISKEIIVKDKKDQAGVVSIITDTDVRNSPKTDLVNVINMGVPSFYTGNNRVMGFGVASSGAATMSIRGIGLSGWGPTTGVPFLINGLDTTTSIMGHPVADIFTMKNIDRIEVLHGPQPVLYGSGAMGGVVNVITKRQEREGFLTELSASYGSYNSTDDYALHQGKIGAFDYGVSYNFQHTDGHREQTISGHEYTSEYVNHNATARFGFEMGEHWYAGMNAYHMAQEIHDPGPEGYTFTGLPPINQDLEIFDIQRNGLSLNVLNSYGKADGMLHVFVNHGVHKAEKPRLDISTYEHEDCSYGSKLVESFTPFSGTKVTVGADVREWGGTAKDPSEQVPYLAAEDHYYIKDKYLTDMSAFGMLEQKLLRVITVSGGARYTDNSEFGGFSSWQAGLIVKPHRTTRVHAAAAQGFKLPDVRQLYLNGPYPVRYPNPDLDPETYLSYEAGIEQDIFGALSLSLTGYRICSDGKIIPVGTFSPPFTGNTWDNAGEFNYNGLEASAQSVLMGMVTIRAGYSFIDNEYRNEKLPYVPKHKALGALSFESSGVYAGLEGEYVYDVYADTAGAEGLSNYLVLNAKLAYTFLARYRLFVNLNNITDRDYETYPGYPMPGFTVMGGLSATL